LYGENRRVAIKKDEALHQFVAVLWAEYTCPLAGGRLYSAQRTGVFVVWKIIQHQKNRLLFSFSIK
jgi:hypothetical protein